jgi:hypothetical protein
MQAVVLNTKVGCGPLDQAYRRLTRHTLLQDFAPQRGPLTASRAGMQMNAAHRSGVLGAMLDQEEPDDPRSGRLSVLQGTRLDREWGT